MVAAIFQYNVFSLLIYIAIILLVYLFEHNKPYLFLKLSIVLILYIAYLIALSHFKPWM